jgi:hypothetical protein
MIAHRYTLEPYGGPKTRHHCPECQQRDKTFALYIDTETGEAISPGVGRCNRESSCGYHFKPKQYFEQNGIQFDKPQPRQYMQPKPKRKPFSFIPMDLFKGSLQGYEANHFTSYLISLFGNDITNELISKYFIGTSKHWNGATVFWQIDTQGKVRTGKIMLYSPTTGKRIKQPFNHISWVHKAIKQPEFELRQCLFGEHLLKGNTKPVAIVESEKTAIIASVYLPCFIWVAVGSLSNLNADKCSSLAGRTVCLFPDLNGFDRWSTKAKELSHLASFTVSDLLECKATEAEREQGFDLADYLIKFDFRELTSPKNLIKPNIENLSKLDIENLTKPHIEKQLWNVSELEQYFETVTLPVTSLKLNDYSTITDASKFIDSHLTTVKFNNGNPTFLPYLERLTEFKEYMTVNELHDWTNKPVILQVP